jgi:hypothetical protein
MRARAGACSHGVVADRKARPSPAPHRSGNIVPVAINAVMLWGAHRILDWGWFPFLTQAWTQVLPILTASLVVAIVVNVLFLAYDGVWLRAPGDILMAAFSIAVSVRMWRVFPFDFSAYAFPWTTVARVLIVVSIVGSAIAIVVEVGRLFRAAMGGPAPAPQSAPEPRHDETAPPAV